MADNKRSRKYDSLCGNPDYAVICSFLNKFSSLLSLPDITFENFERWIGEQRPIPSTFKDFLLCLLKRWRSSANDERFFKYLLKFCESYSPSDAIVLEQHGFEKCDASIKLRLVKNLIEQQFDTNVKFKDKVNMISADELRVQPIGRDVKGKMYWSFMDHDMNLRIFCGELKEVNSNTSKISQNWEIIARNRGELLELIASLENSDLGVEKLFSAPNGKKDEDDDDNDNSNGTTNAEREKESCQQHGCSEIIKNESNVKDEVPTEEELPNQIEKKIIDISAGNKEIVISGNETEKNAEGSFDDKVKINSDNSNDISKADEKAICSDDYTEGHVMPQNEFECDKNIEKDSFCNEEDRDHVNGHGNICNVLSASNDSNKIANVEVSTTFENANNGADDHDAQNFNEVHSGSLQINIDANIPDDATHETKDIIEASDSKQNLNEFKSTILQPLAILCTEKLNFLKSSTTESPPSVVHFTAQPLLTDVFTEEHVGVCKSCTKEENIQEVVHEKLQSNESVLIVNSVILVASSPVAEPAVSTGIAVDSENAGIPCTASVPTVSAGFSCDPSKKRFVELGSHTMVKRKRHFKSCIQPVITHCRKRGISESELSESSLGSGPEDSGGRSSAPEDGPPMKRLRNKALLNRFRRNELHSLSRTKDKINFQGVTGLSSHKISKDETKNIDITTKNPDCMDKIGDKCEIQIDSSGGNINVNDASLPDKGSDSSKLGMETDECDQKGCIEDASSTALAFKGDGENVGVKEHQDLNFMKECTGTEDKDMSSPEILKRNSTDAENDHSIRNLSDSQLHCKEIDHEFVSPLPVKESSPINKHSIGIVECQNVIGNPQTDDPDTDCNGHSVISESLMKSGIKRPSDSQIKENVEDNIGTTAEEQSLSSPEPIAAKKRCCDSDRVFTPSNGSEEDNSTASCSNLTRNNEATADQNLNPLEVILQNESLGDFSADKVEKVVIDASQDISQIESQTDEKNDCDVKDFENDGCSLPILDETISSDCSKHLDATVPNTITSDCIENEESKTTCRPTSSVEIQNSECQINKDEEKDCLDEDCRNEIDNTKNEKLQNTDQDLSCPEAAPSGCTPTGDLVKTNEESKVIDENLPGVAEGEKSDAQKKPKKANACSEEGSTDFVELRRSSRVNKGQRKIEMLELEFPSKRRKRKEDVTEENRERKQVEKERRRTEKMMRQMAEEYEELLQAKKDKKKRFKTVNDDDDDDEDFVPGTRRSLRGKRKKQNNDDEDEDDDDTDSFSEDEEVYDDERTIDTQSSTSEDEVVVLECDGSLYEPTGRNAKRVASLKSVLESENKEQSSVEQSSLDQQCLICDKKSEPEFMLLCDKCDDGYHTWCLRPVLHIIPDGDWFCPPCEHKMLLEKLQKQLCDYDEKAKSNVKLTSRKERLAFVNISLNNLLLEKDLEELPEKVNDSKSRCTTYSSSEDEDDDDDNDKSADGSCGNDDDYDECAPDNEKKMLGGSNSGEVDKENKVFCREKEDDDDDNFMSKKLSKKKNVLSSSESEMATDFDEDDDNEEDEDKDDNSRKLKSRKSKNMKDDDDGDDVKDKKKEGKKKVVDTEEEGSDDDDEGEEEDDDEDDEVEGDWLVTRRSRRQRKDISYKFEEYENLISGAIEDDIKETYGAGNYGRGKDMANITAAKKNSDPSGADKKKRRKKKKFSVLDSDDDGGDCDDEDDESEEFKIDDTSVDEEDEEEDAATELEQSDEEVREKHSNKIPKRELDSLSRKSKRSKKKSLVYNDFVVDEDDLPSGKISKRLPARRAAARRRINYNEYSDDENDEEAPAKREKKVDLSEGSTQNSPASDRADNPRGKNEDKRNRKRRSSKDEDGDDDYLEDEDDEEDDEEDFTPGYREGYSDDDLRNFIKSGSSSSSTCSSSPSRKVSRKSAPVSKGQKKKKSATKPAGKNRRPRKKADGSAGNKNTKKLKNTKKKRKRKPWYTSDSEEEEEASVARDSYSDDDFSSYTAPPPQKRSGRRALRYKDDAALDKQCSEVKPVEAIFVSTPATHIQEKEPAIMQVSVSSPPQNLSTPSQVSQTLLPPSTSDHLNSSSLKTVQSAPPNVQRLNSPNLIAGHQVGSPHPPQAGILRQRLSPPLMPSNPLPAIPNVSPASRFVALATQTAAPSNNVPLPALQAITSQRTPFSPQAISGSQRLAGHEPFTLSVSGVPSFPGQRNIPPLPPLYPIMKNSYLMNAPVAMAMRSGMSSFGGLCSVAPPPPPPLQGRKMNEEQVMVNPFNEKLSSFSVRNITSAAPRSFKPAYGMHEGVDDFIVQDLDISEFLNTDQPNL